LYLTVVQLDVIKYIYEQKYPCHLKEI